MEKLKVGFCNVWPEFKDENIFLPILQKYFDVEVTLSNPSLIIHSIFGGVEEAQKFKCKKILFIGENYRASNYPHDYSISFDPHSDTNYRLPLWQFYLILRPELKNILFGPRVKSETFDRFCSFTVSNPANFLRNGFYDQLNSYKRVHSYGRFKTNDFELQRFSQGKYWRNAKYEFFSKYKHKFALTYEHSSYPYYCTEKLMDGFLAGSMPIYWGDPKVGDDWNEIAFINVMKIKNVIDVIKKIDEFDDVFNFKYNQPIFTEEQKKRHLDNISNFETWLIEKICK
jgi:hypothetical protein